MTSDEKLLIDDCWNRTGVWGTEEPRCPRLQQVIHCQNCSTYSAAGKRLLDRRPPAGYLEEWTENLSVKKDGSRPTAAFASMIVFRIGNEWFALPTEVLREIAEIRSVHSVPHSDNQVLKGLVNIRGELQLCVSLGFLIGLEKGDPEMRRQSKKSPERLVVVKKDNDRFVFPVSEVAGIQHYPVDDLRKLPATLQPGGRFVKGLHRYKDHDVGYLDADLLFHALRRRLS